MFNKFKSLLLYGGLSKEEYDSILPDIHEQNMRDLKAYSTVVTLLLLVSTVAVVALSIFNLSTAFVYFLCAAASAALLILSRRSGRFPRLEYALKYIFVCIIYVFGILVTLAQPDSLAILYMVILVLVPLLFSGRPVIISLATLDAVVLFSICEMIFKDPQLVKVDIVNAVTYGILSIFVAIIIQRVRLQNLMQLRKIAMLSESDILTGLKNRNSFEQNPAVYGNVQNTNVTCIYADVNGLHEVNNTQGHHAGDVMLQTVADAILREYGRDHSYRVGGDEFVVFSFGETPQQTQQHIDSMNESCLAKGYHVSFGYACGHDIFGGLDSLVRSAEEKMYAAKAEFYRSANNDRRRR